MTDAELDRFWSFVDKTESCWFWRGPKNTSGAPAWGGGHGRIEIAGRSFFAHRLAYEIVRGPIPEGEMLIQVCRITNCVAPSHMRLMSKPLGSFSPSTLVEIQRLREAGWKQKDIAKQVGVSVTFVCGALKRMGVSKPPQGPKVPARFSEEQVQKALSMRADGAKLREIASALGCPISAAFALLRTARPVQS